MVHLSRLNIIELENHSWVSGNLVKGKRPNLNSRSILSHLAEVLSSYGKSTVKEKVINVHHQKHVYDLETDKKGHFSALLPKLDWQNASFVYEEEKLSMPNSYPFTFINRESKIEVISDIDDTVLVSHTASALKRMRNILFLLPKKRKTILYTYKLMQAFQSLNWRISYLSKSESNLFHLISDFIAYHELPKGPLLLSPHLKWNQLAKPNKGQDYKLKHLQLMISELPQKKFILIGDDTQRDMEIYTEVVNEFKEQIAMVFIRQTTLKRSEKQEKMWQALQQTGVDATYFDDEADAEIAIQKIKKL